ncbi:SIMPL domain-containing protein [Flagellatimonas centrodinii]|uniref:SIMPL domain-containing protein n=1 Tax=Flagellatimonas centrodinii TaxID=2806210 RepID=UPI001FEDC04A|nr:SIMPL domain-containing protein [Flagellatimonas centrodinii]ULQ47872.1 SIMPL domain-containing protein [Flagellatimonas centrodinii]
MNRSLASLLLISLLSAPALAAAAPSTEAPAPRVITVTGEGEVRATPDQAQLSLAVDAMNKELKLAETEVNGVVRQYLAALAGLKIDTKAISTTGVQIQPEMVWNEKTRRNELVGYRVRRDINIRVTDLAKLGDVLVAATEAGINHINPPVMGSSKAASLHLQALTRATEAARLQAETVSAALGDTLGPARQVNAQPMRSQPPQPMYRMAAMAADSSMESGNVTLGLNAGEIPFTAQVQVEFELLPR